MSCCHIPSMRFVDKSLSAIPHTSYPDTHHVDADCGASLDSEALQLLPGNPGTMPFFPQHNFREPISSRSDHPLAFPCMTQVNQHLANDLSPSHPSLQYTDPIPYCSQWSSSSSSCSSSLSQWDEATSPFNWSAVLGYSLDELGDQYWPGPNDMSAGPFLDDFRSETLAADHTNGTVWTEGIASHCIEQPSYLSVDDAQCLPATMVFTDHNLDFGPSARFTTPPSYDIYPSPPLSPRPLPHDHDHRPISLPTHGSSTSPTINRWKCPHCNYVQGRRRMVDLKRHIATHTKPSDVALWTCCGFPREVARAKGVPDDVLRETSVIYGRVGGCWETFSRRDALQRHLRKQKGRCFGDAYAEWHPGNSNKRDRQAKARARGDDSYQWDE